MLCNKCGKELKEDAAFCFSCGAPTRQEPIQDSGNNKLCNNCGKTLSVNAVFCSECGSPASSKVSSTGNIPADPVRNPSEPIPPEAGQYNYLNQQHVISPVNKQNTPGFPDKPSKNKKKPVIIAIAIIAALVIVSAGLYVTMPQLFKGLPVFSGDGGGKFDVPPISVSGDGSGSGLNTSEPILAAQASIPVEGGKISVADKESPVNGMTIEVPEGSYASATDFTVTTAEIQSSGLYKDLKLVTPLIHVENGGKYSDDLMIVTVPCTIPKGTIPLAFYYTPDSKELEFIPVLDYDSTSVTYGVTHFSDTLVGVVDEYLGKTSTYIDTGFKPGVDDFSFVNFGSAIAPGGHCAGQSLAAMWYYDNLKSKNGPLFGRYDGYGKNPELKLATKDFQDDDVMAYRLASVAQKDLFGVSFAGKMFLHFTQNMNTSNQVTFDTIAALMKMTGQPQLLGVIIRTADNSMDGGHAIIAYRIEGNKIYVADPNKPGKEDRFIEIDNGKFKNYTSADNGANLAAGNVSVYNLITLVGKSSINRYDEFKTLWEDLDKRIVGDNLFPAVPVKLTTKIKTPEGEEDEEITDKYQSKTKELEFKAEFGSDGYAYLAYHADSTMKTKVINLNAATATHKVTLSTGDNYIGICTYKNIGGKPEWYDFQWISVKFETPTLDELVGVYEDGNMKVAEVFISQKLRDEAAAKAAAEAEANEGKTGLDQLDTIGQGCDLKMIEQLDQAKGQSFPTKFSIEKVSDDTGNIVITDEDNEKTLIPFAYKDGVMTVDYVVAASEETANNSFRMKGTLNAAYGKNNDVTIDGVIRYDSTENPEDFYIDEQLTGSMPLGPEAF